MIVITIINAIVRVNAVSVRTILLVASQHVTTRTMVKMMCGASTIRATVLADGILLGKR